MTLEPSIAVATLERALRQLLAHEFHQAWGDGWLDRVTKPEQRERWRARAQDEQSRRPGVLGLPDVGLEYSELYELIAMAEANWDKVARALGRKKSMVPLLERFERLRNPTNHSRELLSFERDYLSGVAGEVQNKVTIYMSTKDPAGDYYPRIEAARDSFGSAITVYDVIGDVAGVVSASEPRMIVQLGDVVTFTCVGSDPQGRDLAWTLSSTPRANIATGTSRSGEPIELQWQTAEEDVSEATAVQIYMSAVGARFHRSQRYDHRAYFLYIVRPPADS